IMDIVIDIQGFCDVEDNFIPKEVAVLAINAMITGHWIMRPPYPFGELPERELWTEPISVWAAMDRANQNATFNYLVIPPSRHRPIRAHHFPRQTRLGYAHLTPEVEWRGFVLTAHSCPLTTNVPGLRTPERDNA
ncbi:hypothetical protein ALC57_02231, partial [Trachymyrmex cornetzi]